jgi:hypothetical protein
MTRTFIHNSNVWLTAPHIIQWLVCCNIRMKLITTIKEAPEVMNSTLLEETFKWQTTYQSYNQPVQEERWQPYHQTYQSRDW